MSIFKKILKAGKGILSVAGPTLGLALGGPLGGMAISKLTKALGVNEDALEGILSAPSANQLEKIKLAEAELVAECKKLEINLEEYRIDAMDRDSARKREMTVGDNTNKILAYLVTAGFFAVLGVFAFGNITAGPSMTVLNIMVGSLGTSWVAIIGYYFGSSKGSKDKTAAMASKLNGG